MQRRSAFVIALLLCAALVLSACGGSAAINVEQVPQQPAGSTGNNSEPASEPNTRPNTTDTHAQNESGSTSAESPPDGAAPAPGIDAETAAEEAPPDEQSPQRDRPQPTRERETPPEDEEIYDSTFFQNYGTNPFVDAMDDPESTFAMDVDTASYSVMRRYLADGYLPDPNSVRVEEYLNYFDYQYPQPEDGSNFAIYTEVAPSPFGAKGYEMVQVGIQGRAIDAEDRRPTSLTFVIDVSGSMDREGRLETVKDALTMLVEELGPDDQIGIVVYGSEAESILPPTSGANKRRILAAIDDLQPSGSTNVEAGLDIGFEQAAESLVRGNNMILLCSDGVANNGVTDPEALLEKYQEYLDQGIKLSTFGFGMGNYNDVLMEQLADSGDGFYTYIDTLDEAQRVFVENLTGTLQLIARDAKIQVEFNPDVVSRYRLVGYENRDVADRDFRNDAVDAGEIGAGHSVTALYEIKRVREAEGDIATVRIRYHRPDQEQVVEEAQTLHTDDRRATADDMSSRFQLAVSVAEYAELLRHDYWTEGTLLDQVVDMSRDAGRSFEEDPDVEEFVRLVNQAARLAPDE